MIGTSRMAWSLTIVGQQYGGVSRQRRKDRQWPSHTIVVMIAKRGLGICVGQDIMGSTGGQSAETRLQTHFVQQSYAGQFIMVIRQHLSSSGYGFSDIFVRHKVGITLHVILSQKMLQCLIILSCTKLYVHVYCLALLAIYQNKYSPDCDPREVYKVSTLLGYLPLCHPAILELSKWLGWRARPKLGVLQSQGIAITKGLTEWSNWRSQKFPFIFYPLGISNPKWPGQIYLLYFSKTNQNNYRFNYSYLGKILSY